MGTKKLKFLEIFLSILGGIGLAIVSLIGIFLIFGLMEADSNSSLMITLSSTIIYLAICFSFYLIMMQPNRISFGEMGFKKVPFGVILKMIPLGIGVFIANVALIIILSLTLKSLVPDNPTPLDSVVNLQDAVLIGFMLIFVAPIIEEFVFRGIIYRYLRQKMRVLFAVIISGILFGALHDVVPALALVGAALALIYERYKSLYPAIVVHMVNNIMVMGVFLLTHPIK